MSQVKFLINLIRVVKNWPTYVFNKFGFIKKDFLTYKLRNGLTCTLRRIMDRSALADVWLDDSYDPNIFGLKFDWEECETVMDIGANIGAFVLYASYKAPNAKIFAYEPEKANMELTQKNIRDNNLENRAYVFQKGIGAATEEKTFFISQRDSGGHSLFAHKETSQSITISIISLQEAFKINNIQICNFMKIDCEGAEYDILFNASSDLLAKIQWMAVEYHHFSERKEKGPQELREYLMQNGFEIFPGKKSMFFARNKSYRQ